MNITVGFAVGCYKNGFDPTYSIGLNGIISQDEFREAIEKINRKISFDTAIIRLLVIFILGSVVGGTCLFTGYVQAHYFGRFGIPPIMGVGIVLILLSVIIEIAGVIIINSRRTARMREAIAEESMKYSLKSPSACKCY